jgi:phosphoribosyl-ATP pyrophosphohydrolase/phosphoribosyl-AMP cyclohydrolase
VSDARDPGPLTSGPARTLGGVADAVRYDADGLVPCVCQDAATGEVLMVAWQDEAALSRTLASRRATFWSRSRGELWEKGATSGNVLAVEWARVDCDGDTVLLGVTPSGPACHTGARSCFGDDGASLLPHLARLLTARRAADPQASYASRLLNGPRAHAARKVGEEALEVVLAEPGSDALVGEVADLVFHALLLLAHDDVDPLAPLRVLAERRADG